MDLAISTSATAQKQAPTNHAIRDRIEAQGNTCWPLATRGSCIMGTTSTTGVELVKMVQSWG